MTSTLLKPEAIATADRICWDCPTLDSDLHILESLGEPLPLPDHIDSGNWATEEEPALLRWFARETHQQYVQVLRDNTYNHDQDLSAQLLFSVFAPEEASDWCWCDDLYVVVERHLGGDVRGNYGSFSVFRVDRIGESGFFDWVCGWFARPIAADYDSDWPALQRWNDRFSVGYSGWPTGEVRDALTSKKPAWSDKHGAYVARLEDVPFPVILEPVAPYYGG